MLLQNARVFLPDGSFAQADILSEGGVIAEVGPHLPGDGEDLAGLTVIPGLCDIHTHGCVGGDWSRGGAEDYRRMLRYYAANGVTSVCAATMSLPETPLREAMARLGAFIGAERDSLSGAAMCGINMEGPFFSGEKCGAQDPENLREPSATFFEEMQAAAGGHILLCDFAPELPGADAFLAAERGKVVLSLAHTAADYETARRAIEAGAGHVTHLYNAMTPFTHRAPGVVGAAFDSPVTAELIADGVHVDPAAVRVTFRMLGGRAVLISDSMEACGMPDGVYELGGQEVFVRGGRALLRDGTIAGSCTNLFTCMVRAIRFGVPECDAVMAATGTPARVIGLEKHIGSIAPGRKADLVVVDGDYHIRRVYTGGREFGG